MEKLKEVSTRDLIQELKNRGYKTDLIFGLLDVEYQLEQVNADREEDDVIILDEDDKNEILERVFYATDYYTQLIYDNIEEKILDYEN